MTSGDRIWCPGSKKKCYQVLRWAKDDKSDAKFSRAWGKASLLPLLREPSAEEMRELPA